MLLMLLVICTSDMYLGGSCWQDRPYLGNREGMQNTPVFPSTLAASSRMGAIPFSCFDVFLPERRRGELPRMAQFVWREQAGDDDSQQPHRPFAIH
jgi:hypothetical protein